MTDFVSGYSPLIQFVVSVYALASGVLIACLYTSSRRRAGMDQKHRLTVELRSFNINNLKSLKQGKLIPDEQASVSVEDLRTIWKNDVSSSWLRENAVGSYDFISTILSLDSGVRSAQRVFWVTAIGTVVTILVISILFFNWEPATISTEKDAAPTVISE